MVAVRSRSRSRARTRTRTRIWTHPRSRNLQKAQEVPMANPTGSLEESEGDERRRFSVLQAQARKVWKRTGGLGGCRGGGGRTGEAQGKKKKPASLSGTPSSNRSGRGQIISIGILCPRRRCGAPQERKEVMMRAVERQREGLPWAPGGCTATSSGTSWLDVWSAGT